jgi:hypothetical protein
MGSAAHEIPGDDLTLLAQIADERCGLVISEIEGHPGDVG